LKIEPKAVWHVFGTCNRAVLLGLAVATLAIILYSKSIADGAGFLYDELGRLVGVSDSTGVTAVYNYDAVGNLTSIDRFTPPGSGIGPAGACCSGGRLVVRRRCRSRRCCRLRSSLMRNLPGIDLRGSRLRTTQAVDSIRSNARRRLSQSRLPCAGMARSRRA